MRRPWQGFKALTLPGCRLSTDAPPKSGCSYSFRIQCTEWWVLFCHIPITDPWCKPQFCLQYPWGCASWSTSMSSTAVFGDQGAVLQLPWGFWVLLARARHQTWLLPFPAAYGTPKPPGTCPGGKLPLSPDIRHLFHSLPLNACSSWSSGHVGAGVGFLLMRIRRNLLIKGKKT